MGSSNRLTVLTSARGSHAHGLNLEKLLKILGLELPTNEISEVTFEFEGMLPSEMLLKIVEYDALARDFIAIFWRTLTLKLFQLCVRTNLTNFIMKY